MATQGMVTVLASSNKVVAKIVCGCNGQLAQGVGDAIAERPNLHTDALYEIASEMGFGCKDCLVAMSEDEIVYRGDGEISSLYRETFSQPYYNPRWLRGDGAMISLVFWPT